MPALRHLLLAFIIFAAQLVAGVHAVEHVLGDKDGLPPHACALCLEAHDLGAALPALPPVIPVTNATTEKRIAPPVAFATALCPTPRQGAPPAA